MPRATPPAVAHLGLVSDFMATSIAQTESDAAPPGSRFSRRFLGITIGLNLLALAVAWVDRSWIAFGIAMLWGPILNAVLFLSTLLFLSRLKAVRGFSFARFFTISLGAPIIAAVVDYFAIFAMGLHGC